MNYPFKSCGFSPIYCRCYMLMHFIQNLHVLKQHINVFFFFCRWKKTHAMKNKQSLFLESKLVMLINGFTTFSAKDQCKIKIKNGTDLKLYFSLNKSELLMWDVRNRPKNRTFSDEKINDHETIRKKQIRKTYTFNATQADWTQRINVTSDRNFTTTESDKHSTAELQGSSRPENNYTHKYWLTFTLQALI